ncbi:glycoside hydrolase family 61 [Fusarium albosuccineum]|uniref:lytic cellulose monooxygenase (C4-dehydrogenating) n=1 Tax=Fusarium albosuccineum TaxID=1237068 RepID=A0A8H4PIU0_9HYPO|nr:glycoside hydrolase family 61 [Fusarium albosuccineum]
MYRTNAFLGLVTALLAGQANAHGHVKQITAAGKTYTGGLPHSAPADAVGWAAGNQDNGFVEPNSFSSADIICHKSATPVSNSVAVAAGETITLTWDTWPESHHGPVIDYLAPVSGEFASINKESLRWTKIAEKGLISGSNPGSWAADQLISNGFSWTFTVPRNLKAGNYVLRHEIIALHSAGQTNGAQAYPQCINLKVSGSGSGALSGGDFKTFYTPEDPGILFSLYQAFTSYEIPGPDVQSV